MARNLLADSPIDTVMPRSRSTWPAKRASTRAALMPCSRSVPVKSRKASSIDSGSTSGVSANMARAHVAADFAVFRDVRFDDHGLRAAALGLEHRHRRADAVGARHVAAGRDHAAFAAADDHRLVDQRRIVALFDGGVEGVAIDMRDGQALELGMAREPWRAAGRTARCGVRRIRQTVAAEAHGMSRSQWPPRAASALPIWAGSTPVSAAKADKRRSSPAR